MFYEQEITDDTSFNDCALWIDCLEKIHQAERLADMAPSKRLHNSSVSRGKMSEQLGRYHLY
jgi:hypothetical protein